MQLSVEQLREKLLELGIDPKDRPKPQLQLELLQVLKFELVAIEVKSRPVAITEVPVTA